MKEKVKPRPKMLRGFDDDLWLKIRAIVAGQGKGIGPWLEEAAKEKMDREKGK